MPAPRTTGRSSAARTASVATGTAAGSARDQLAQQQRLALQQVLAARPDLPAEQAARLAAALVARSTGGRPAGRRPARGRSTPPRAARRTRRAPAGERTPKQWSARLGVVALSTLLLPVAAVLAIPGAAEPRDPRGPVDVTEVALAAQQSLMDEAGRYRELEQEVADRLAAQQEAEAALATVAAQVEAQQQVLGANAAELYRSQPAQRYPLLGLDVRDADATAAALYAQAIVDRADRERDGAAIRAERTLRALEGAQRAVAATRAALTDARDRADGVLRLVRDKVEGLGPEVTGRIAGLAVIPSAGPQQARNEAATRRWQDYLARLALAGIEPPTAARLTDPASLPPGLSPALDASARPIPGVAWGIVGSSPVTVLPAETVAAVSTALSQMGKPFIPEGRGPDGYDCGGFTSAAWLLAGHALSPTPQGQWAEGAPVGAEALQVGDLVFTADGRDVGLYLGEGEVVSASAGSYQVGVHDLPAGASGVRVTLPPPAQPNAPLTGLERTEACGAPLPSPERVGSPAWGGWQNGQIPSEALCELGVHRHALRCDAAASYRELSTAYEATFGTPLCITDSYRSLGGQISAFSRKPALAAFPGTSTHGWALAVDLCGGVNVAGTPQWTWMTQHAHRFGFVQPDWASPAGEKPEPWHWEYGYIS